MIIFLWQYSQQDANVTHNNNYELLSTQKEKRTSTDSCPLNLFFFSSKKQ